LNDYIDWTGLAANMGERRDHVFQTGFDEVHIFWSR